MQAVHDTLDSTSSGWQLDFLTMLPAILKFLQILCRHEQDEAREETIQEAVANTCVAYARLAERGAVARAFPSVLARFAISQVRDGRRVGNRRNIRDVLSPVPHRPRRVVERLDRFDVAAGAWRAAVVEDPATPVAEQVCFRLDFATWLERLSDRDRRIAETLSVGHAPRDVARRFGISATRISQLRREFYESWRQFWKE